MYIFRCLTNCEINLQNKNVFTSFESLFDHKSFYKQFIEIHKPRQNILFKFIGKAKTQN